MGKGCSLQPYCISTLHGGHTGLRRHDAFTSFPSGNMQATEFSEVEAGSVSPVAWSPVVLHHDHQQTDISA